MESYLGRSLKVAGPNVHLSHFFFVPRGDGEYVVVVLGVGIFPRSQLNVLHPDSR
jgi:hypothetical protein